MEVLIHLKKLEKTNKKLELTNKELEMSNNVIKSLTPVWYIRLLE